MIDYSKKGFLFLLITGCLIVVILLLGQMMAFINYDFTVSIGLQESVEQITPIGVAFNKGFGVGDTLIYLPLLLWGLIGTYKRKATGLFTLMGAMAITAYWPVVCLSAVCFAKGLPGWTFSAYIEYTILLFLITLYGLWGMWYLYKHRNELID